jgi:hypothetical protein
MPEKVQKVKSSEDGFVSFYPSVILFIIVAGIRMFSDPV